MNKILTTGEVAKKFGVSNVTAWSWCNAGYFPNARKISTPRGDVWEIPESDTTNFEKPSRGRPADPNPSDVTLAKRRSRPLRKPIT